MTNLPSYFKAYDIRGKVPGELNENLAYALGMALAQTFKAASAVTGRDVRASGATLQAALNQGLIDAHVKVESLEICGTEEIYHASATGDYDLGIMVTGSHNPKDENGFKIVLGGAIPVSMDSGLDKAASRTMRLLAEGASFIKRPGAIEPGRMPQFRQKYVEWLLNYAGLRPKRRARPLKVLVDAGNGSAGVFLRELAPYLPFELVSMGWEPDETFPNGIPNPLLPEKRSCASRATLASGADVGVAFDGDFDRCFFYDHMGNFIEGYYLVGLLAARLLEKMPGEKIIHDPRVYWNTREMILQSGGVPIMGKTGHAFMKEKMRAENALYGGEMSAHHYFRDFFFCDSGMLAMLLILGYLDDSGKSLRETVAERMKKYPCSGEINFKAVDSAAIMEKIYKKYAPSAIKIDAIDGINLEFPAWRFNLRASNTEPILRLNVESRNNEALLQDMTEELKKEIGNFASA